MIFKIVSVTSINYGYTDNRGQTDKPGHNRSRNNNQTGNIGRRTCQQRCNNITIQTYSGGLKGGVTVDTATVVLATDREKC